MTTLNDNALNARLSHQAHDPGRTFFTAMAGVALAVVLVGFAPSFYLNAFLDAKPLSPLIHVHGLLFTLWPMLFLTQSMLARAGRIELHRALGVVGVVLAASMVISGYLIATHRSPPSVGSPQFLLGATVMRAAVLGQIYQLLLFAALVMVAIRLRRNSGVHKRLMLIATFSILPAAVARILRNVGIEPLPHLGFVLPWGLMLLACVIYDVVTQRRLHPATVWGGLFVVLRHPLTSSLGFTEQWQTIAVWLADH
ncbi:MAG: hypothetical protein ABW049_07215 [Spongiibacteraceae bacterium]